MKNMKKILVFVMSMLLVMALSITGTLAWLNSLTDPVTNTFTVGNVTITLDEADVYTVAEQKENTSITDEMLGTKEADKPRVQANSYKLVPDKTYDKDPTVHVDANSEDCYVFVKVINTLTGMEVQNDTDKPTIAKQMETLGWKPLTGEANVYYYYGDLAEEGRVVAGTDLTVFTNFHIAADANVTTAPGDVIITAYAVQAENTDDPATAWSLCKTNWTK